MLRGLLILVAVLVGAFWIFGGRSSDDERRKERIVETPFGTIHSVTRDETVLRAFREKGGPEPWRTADVKLVWQQSSMGKTYAERMKNLRAHAGTAAALECQRLLHTVASRCRVSDVAPDATAGEAALKTYLQFVPKQALGEVPAARELLLNEVQLDYPDFDRKGIADSDKAAPIREAIYAEIAKDCQEIAPIYGNCLLYRIRIDARLGGPEGNRIVRTDAHADMGILRAYISGE